MIDNKSMIFHNFGWTFFLNRCEEFMKNVKILYFSYFFSFSLDKVISMLYVHIGYELNYLMTF